MRYKVQKLTIVLSLAVAFELAGSFRVVAQAQPAVQVLGTSFKDCEECPEMVMIPGGQFVMGSAPGEEEREKLPERVRNRSQPQHVVKIASFSAGRYEITRAQYRAFVEATGRERATRELSPYTDLNPKFGCIAFMRSKLEQLLSLSWRDPGYSQDDNHPVACVNWFDAKDYVRWLSMKTGKAYRLLTEAEWEYAARANSTTARFWGDDGDLLCNYDNGADLTVKGQPRFSRTPVANCDDRYANTSPVGSYGANPFGLHDLLGNVGEWTEDCWNEHYIGAPEDGSAWRGGLCPQKVVRGGAWSTEPWGMRSAHRTPLSNSWRMDAVGFRVARTD